MDPANLSHILDGKRTLGINMRLKLKAFSERLGDKS
jgi:hypothetical protein